MNKYTPISKFFSESFDGEDLYSDTAQVISTVFEKHTPDPDIDGSTMNVAYAWLASEFMAWLTGDDSEVVDVGSRTAMAFAIIGVGISEACVSRLKQEFQWSDEDQTRAWDALWQKRFKQPCEDCKTMVRLPESVCDACKATLDSQD
jgi:hypothetical protein